MAQKRKSSTPITCKFCRSTTVVKKGKRKLKGSTQSQSLPTKQMYLCKSCGKVFTPDTTAGKKTPPNIILTAVTKYCQNLTLKETQKLIEKQYKTKPALSAIHKWVEEFNPRYLQIKSKLARKYPVIIKSFRFYHSGQIYNYKYHVPKLKEFTTTSSKRELISYLENLPKFIDNEKFNNSNRCSQTRLDTSKMSLTQKQNTFLNQITRKALIFAKTNKRRHQVIEDYLLCTDRDTIAVEVPVYFYDKKLGAISGHIDILQSKNSKIYILDYKPNITSNGQKSIIQQTMTQLTLYAIALSFRANVSLKDIRCAFFNQNDYYEFKPNYSLPHAPRD
jgi:transposase-like protein